MAIRATQRGGSNTGRGDNPYVANYRTTTDSVPAPTINTPMVTFATPQEEEQKKKQQSSWRQPDWTQVTLMQLSPASRLTDGNPFT